MPRLHDRPELVAWLGNKPFTGRSLFSHLIFDLLSQLTVDEDIPDRSKLAPTKGRGKNPAVLAMNVKNNTNKNG